MDYTSCSIYPSQLSAEVFPVVDKWTHYRHAPHQLFIYTPTASLQAPPWRKAALHNVYTSHPGMIHDSPKPPNLSIRYRNSHGKSYKVAYPE